MRIRKVNLAAPALLLVLATAVSLGSQPASSLAMCQRCGLLQGRSVTPGQTLARWLSDLTQAAGGLGMTPSGAGPAFAAGTGPASAAEPAPVRRVFPAAPIQHAATPTIRAFLTDLPPPSQFTI